MIAEGNACPISHDPMDDINPHYVPATRKSLPLIEADQNRIKGAKSEAKSPIKPRASGGILDFFGEF